MTYSPKMSAMRQQLPQRPGDTPPEAERSFAYPPIIHGHTRPHQQPPPPPFDRHPSYPTPVIPPSPGYAYGPPSHMHDRAYFPGPHEMAPRAFGPPPGHHQSNGHERHQRSTDERGNGHDNGNSEGGGKENKKKRPQDLSLDGQNGAPAANAGANASARRQSTSKQSKPESASSEKPPAPSVLVREKKQKACSNCRRAKLKCIVNDGDTDCVRCKSRIERCVFFPRTHDEDWQQTITHDVYSALAQLQSVSLAMQHMVNHLVSNNMIPPLPPMDFPHGMPLYEVPDRDMTVLQGWNAEKTKGDSTTKKKRKARQEEEEDDDDEYRFESNQRLANPPGLPHPQMMLERPTNMGWAHISPDQNGATMHQLPPYIAPGHPGQVQLTPTSELDIPRRTDLDSGRSASSFPYPPLAISPSAMMSGSMPPGPLPQVPGQVVVQPSPSIHHATPASMGSSHHISPPLLSGGLPQLAPPAQTHVSQTLEVDVEELLAPAQDMPKTHDADGNPIIGSADGRKNLIQEGYLSNRDANILVQHFYANLAPFMFGYQLEVGRFPFLEEGLTTLTPFIMGVMVMLSAERIPQYRSSVDALKQYIVNALHDGPAGSWQDIQSSRAELRTDESIDKLDPELGIGPEEIVGACVLGAYLRADDVEEMGHIAKTAFTWARGWIKILCGAPRSTLAEFGHFVCQERVAHPPDMWRIWLLCYVLQGTTHLAVSLARGTSESQDSHDPAFYYEQLLHPEDPSAQVSPYDIALIYRAKLVDIIKTWYRKSGNLWNRGPNAAFDLKRLATVTTTQLDEWRRELAGYGELPPGLSRQLSTFDNFARVLISSHAVRSLDANDPSTLPTRRVCLSQAITAALDFVGQFLEWTARDIASMPTYDLSMLNIVTTFLQDASCPGHGYDTEPPGAQRPLPVNQVRPLLHMLADKFNKRHNEKSGCAYVEIWEALQQRAEFVEMECRK